MKRRTKTLRVLIQVLVLAVLAAWVAGIMIRRGTPGVPDSGKWTQRDGFVAISYGGVARDEGGALISRQRLRSHLEALAKAGFQTVTVQNIIDFYNSGAPLPDKALFLMFEGGRKDSAIYGQEALEATGMRAAMFIQTDQVGIWTRTFLQKREIAALENSPYWEVGSHGNALYIPNTADRERPTYFLTDLIRNGSGKAVETLPEFAARAEGDFASAEEVLKAAAGHSPAAGIFMPANTYGNTLDEELEYINGRLLAKYYRISFTREGVGYNNYIAGGRELSRMQVPKNFSAQQLLDRISAWQPGREPYVYRRDEPDTRWQVEVGALERHPRELAVISGETRNSFAWLSGSENWQNMYLAVQVARSADCEQSLYLRYASRRAYLRIRLYRDTLMVQERTPERGLSTIAAAGIPPDGYLALRVVVKNDRIWVSVNGKPISDQPFPIPKGLIGGRVAVEARGEGAGPHKGFFQEAVFTPIPERWELATATRAGAGVGAAWPENLVATGLIVPLPGDGESGEALAATLLRSVGSGEATYARLPSGSFDLELVASITRGLPEVLRRYLWTGVVFSLSGDGQWQWSKLPEVAAEAKRRGLKPVVLLTPPQADRLAALHDTLPVDSLLLVDEGRISAATVEKLRHRYRNVMFENSKGACFIKR